MRGNHKHGFSRTTTHTVWKCMRQRCLNPNNPAFKNYGGRGIRICWRWEKFENFLTDMGPRPSGLTLERRNNNKGYSKSNCYWATRIEQGRNRRDNVLLTFRGKSMSVGAWSETLGINEHTLYTRVNRLGWSVQKALTTPAKESYSHV